MPNHIMKHASFCNAIIILSKRSISMNENAAKNLRKLFYIWNNDPWGPIRDDRRAKWLHYTQKLQKLHFSYPQQWLSFIRDRRTCPFWLEYLDEKPVLNDGGEANGKSIFVIVTITIVWRIICRAWIRIATLIGLTLLSDWSDYSSNENHAWEDNHRHLYHYHNQRNR